MKPLFCDSCIRDILNVAEGRLGSEFVIFDVEEKSFQGHPSGLKSDYAFQWFSVSWGCRQIRIWSE